MKAGHTSRDAGMLTNNRGGSAVQHRAFITELCARRGVILRQLPSGAYRLTGEGVDILVTNLALVSASDLSGEVWTKRRNARDVETTTRRGPSSFPVPSNY